MSNDIGALRPSQESSRFMPLAEKKGAPKVLARDLQARKRAEDEVAQLREASKDFEAVFLFQILKQMRNTIHKEEMFNGGMGEEIFTGMMDEEISKRMAGRGAGGIAEILFQQLSRQHGIGDQQSPEGPGKKLLLDATQSAGALMRQLQGVNAIMNASKTSTLIPDF
jgi:Rod binding domain-containing protein